MAPPSRSIRNANKWTGITQDLLVNAPVDFILSRRVQPIYYMGFAPNAYLPTAENRSAAGATLQTGGAISGVMGSGGTNICQINALKANVTYEIYYLMNYVSPDLLDLKNVYLTTGPGSVTQLLNMIPGGVVGPLIFPGITSVSIDSQGLADHAFTYSANLWAVPVL